MTSNPFLNWRWWAMLAPTFIISMLWAILRVLQACGEVCGELADTLHVTTLRKLVFWTWGGSND